MTMAWTAGTKGAVRGKAVLAPKNKKELDEAKEKKTLAGTGSSCRGPVRSAARTRRFAVRCAKNWKKPKPPAL